MRCAPIVFCRLISCVLNHDREIFMAIANGIRRKNTLILVTEIAAEIMRVTTGKSWSLYKHGRNWKTYVHSESTAERSHPVRTKRTKDLYSGWGQSFTVENTLLLSYSKCFRKKTLCFQTLPCSCSTQILPLMLLQTLKVVHKENLFLTQWFQLSRAIQLLPHSMLQSLTFWWFYYPAFIYSDSSHWLACCALISMKHYKHVILPRLET